MDSILGAVVFFPGPNAASLILRGLGISVFALFLGFFFKVWIQSPLFIGCTFLVLPCGMAGGLQKGFRREEKRKQRHIKAELTDDAKLICSTLACFSLPDFTRPLSTGCVGGRVG